jgi:hypothetical protein
MSIVIKKGDNNNDWFDWSLKQQVCKSGSDISIHGKAMVVAKFFVRNPNMLWGLTGASSMKVTCYGDVSSFAECYTKALVHGYGAAGAGGGVESSFDAVKGLHGVAKNAIKDAKGKGSSGMTYNGDKSGFAGAIGKVKYQVGKRMGDIVHIRLVPTDRAQGNPHAREQILGGVTELRSSELGAVFARFS